MPLNFQKKMNKKLVTQLFFKKMYITNDGIRIFNYSQIVEFSEILLDSGCTDTLVDHLPNTYNYFIDAQFPFSDQMPVINPYVVLYLTDSSKSPFSDGKSSCFLKLDKLLTAFISIVDGKSENFVYLQFHSIYLKLRRTICISV